MAVLVILVLAVLWAAVLVPPILRSRNASGRFGLSDFTDGLRSLGGRASHSRPVGNGPAFGGPVLHGPVGQAPLGSGPGAVGPYSGYAAPYGGAPTGPVPGRPGPAGLPVPTPFGPAGGGMTPMQRRRRNVLVVLGSAVGVTLVLALATRLVVLYLLLLVALAALGGYCYLLVQFKQRSTIGRAAPMQHVVVTPVTPAEEQARPVDNVILLRRNVG